MSTALLMAWTMNIEVVAVRDHDNHGTFNSGKLYRKTPSIATHFMKSHNESVWSESNLK